MNFEIQELKVVGLYKERMEMDSRTDGYRYPFKLSSHPEPLWVSLFEKIWEKTWYTTHKRKAYISGDCIVIILWERDDPQSWLEIIKRAVNDTNAEHNEVRQKNAKEQELQERLLRKKKETLNKLRKEADKLQF